MSGDAIAWALAAGLAGACRLSAGLAVLFVAVLLAASRRLARVRGRWRDDASPLAPATVPASIPAGPGSEVESPFVLSGEFDLPVIPSRDKRSRSGMFDPPEAAEDEADPGEMTSRLHPRSLRWIESSPAERQFLGWDLGTLRHKSFLDVVDRDDLELARDQLAAAIGKGEGHSLLYRIRTARGEIKAVEIHLSVRYDQDGQPGYVRLRMADMTRKIRADRELRRRTRELIDANAQLRLINRQLVRLKDRYTDLYQNAPALYFSLDPAGTVVECNETLLATLGRSREEVVGRPYAGLLGEEHGPAFPAWFADLKQSGYVELESRWVKRDGEVIDVWLASTAVLGPDGAFRRSRSVGRDVTARRALEAELSRKNKELDAFAHVVAHDLKEPLRTLIAFSGFLEKDCGDRLDAPGRESLRHIVEAARRMRSLIEDLQTLGRAGRVAGDFGRVAPGPLLSAIRDDLAELIRDRGASVRVASPLPDLWGDRTRIAQLFANLIGNGLKYNRNAHPVVEVALAELESTPGEAADGFATMVVRDNGIGIATEFHDKVFDLFRRLHARDEFDGTGAGLAICKTIVEAHGGRVWVESCPGDGSSFFVRLPLPPDAPPDAEPDADADATADATADAPPAG